MSHFPKPILLGLASLLLTIGILLLAPSTVLAGQKETQGKAIQPFDLIPKDHFILICVNYENFWNGSDAKVVRRLSKEHPYVISTFLTYLGRKADLPVDDLQRVILMAISRDGLVAIFNSKQPFPFDTFVQKFGPGAKTVKAGKFTFEKDDKRELAYFLHEKHTMLLSSPEVVAKIHTTPQEKVISKETQQSLQQLLSQHFIVGRLNPKAFTEMVFPDGIQPNNPFSSIATADKIQLLASADKNLQVEFQATYNNEADAKKAQEIFKKNVKQLDNYLGFMLTQLPAFYQRSKAQGLKDVDFLKVKLDAAAEDFRKALKKAEVELKNNTVRINATIETEEPRATALLLLSSFTPRGAKKN